MTTVASGFTSRVANARRAKRCQELGQLSAEWSKARAIYERNRLLSQFNREYGSTDPLEGVACGVAAPAPAPSTPVTQTPALPSGPAAPSPSPAPSFEHYDISPVPTASAPPSSSPTPTGPGVAPSGTPKGEGEYYGDANEVWAGNEVTRRACEIQQKGARGACDRFGLPWGGAAVDPQNPTVNLGSQGVGFGVDEYYTPAPEVTDQGAQDAVLAVAEGGDIAAAADAATDASAPPPPKSSFPWGWVIAGAAALALFGGARAVRRRRRAA